MTVTETEESVAVNGGAMRTILVRPNGSGPFPAILFYSDIFQLTPSTRRMMARLAGHGFLVAAPEIYHGCEPAGAAFPFDDPGRTRGMEDAAKISVASWDEDTGALIDFLKQHDDVDPERLGSIGFCLGGHLAFRSAFRRDIRATACFYPTGVEDGKLGSESDCGSLARASEIRGDLLLAFGTRDPHVSFEGRTTIRAALHAAGTSFRMLEYDAEHAFMRDEGPRYDPAATDTGLFEAVTFYRSAFA